jgi:hypothetical protein
MEVHSMRGTARGKIFAASLTAAIVGFAIALALASGPGAIK